MKDTLERITLLKDLFLLKYELEKASSTIYSEKNSLKFANTCIENGEKYTQKNIDEKKIELGKYEEDLLFLDKKFKQKSYVRIYKNLITGLHNFHFSYYFYFWIFSLFLLALPVFIFLIYEPNISHWIILIISILLLVIPPFFIEFLRAYFEDRNKKMSKKNYIKERNKIANNINFLKNEIEELSIKNEQLIKEQNVLIKRQNIVLPILTDLYNELQRRALIIENTINKVASTNNFLFEKYLNLEAINTFIEYLSSGRCSDLGGPCGCYNLYEEEIRAGIIISNLKSINNNLFAISNKLSIIHNDLNEINYTLEDFKDCLKDFSSSIGSSAEKMISKIDLLNKNSEYIKACQTFLIEENIPYNKRILALIKARNNLKY